MNLSKQRSLPGLLASAFALALGAYTPHASALGLNVVNAQNEVSVGPNDFFADGVSRTFSIGPLALDLQGAPAALAIYTFLFQESGANNQFVAPGGTPAALNDPGDLFASLTRTYSTNGALNFNFVSPLGTVTNGSNTTLTEPNFGILLNANLNTLLPAGAVRTSLASRGLLGTYDAILFLNDGGAGQDRDFDDMVLGLNIRAVPEPGIFAMLTAGLLALGWIGRRRIR